MSIIEAMSAGVVPIAFRSGGPREIIMPDVNGYLWQDRQQLKSLSLRLIEDADLLQRLSATAVSSSRAFEVNNYLDRMDRIIENLTASPARKQTNEGRGKKIALLTAFDHNFREIAERTVPTMRRYAETFDLEFISMPPPTQDRPASWGKIQRIREVLQSV